MTTSSSSGLHVGENVQCKGLSSVVQIKYSETFGRHMIASEDIPAGSLLIDEVPYALTIDQGCEQFYCDWCTKAFDDRRTVLKCDRCKEDTLNWCSPECRRQADESYHGMECGKIRTWIEQFHMHGVLLAVRIVARLKWNEIDLDSILDDKTKSSDEDNGCTIQTPSDHIRSLLRLTSDEETISGPEKCAITTLATRIIQEIHERDHMKSTTKESRFPSQLPAAGLMTRFLEQLIHRLARNRQGLWEHQTFQDVELSKLIRKTDGHKACALYPNAALLNHACRPNVYPTYGENGRIQIRNIRQLKSGEQLLHCYGMKFGEMARAQRQKSLSAQYYFTCACEACTSQEASKAEFESESFFCEICHKVLNTHNGECPTEPDEHPNRMQILGRFEADNKTLSNLDEKSIRTLIEQMMQLEPLCHANNKRLCDLRKEAAEALLKIGQHKRWHYYHRPMVLVEVRLISSRSQVACAQYNNYDNYNSNQYGGPPGRGFGRGRDENLEPCQCSTFDPCVQQEWQKMEQCAMRTCPAQVFDQLHQDWMKCWSDVPQADQRLIQCVEGQIGKSCQGGSVRGKRQTRPGNNNANYYNVQYQQQQPSSGAGSETGFDRLFATIQNGLGQWQAYGECMQTCMNTTRQQTVQNGVRDEPGMRKGKGMPAHDPYSRCAMQLNCRLIKPTFDQVQTAIQTCSNQLGINWRDEAITKCRCLEALGTSWISCNTLELFSSQIDDATILEMASTYMAVMAGAE